MADLAVSRFASPHPHSLVKQALTDRFCTQGLSSVEADIVFGVAPGVGNEPSDGINNAVNADGDPIAELEPLPLAFCSDEPGRCRGQSIDFGDPESQRAVSSVLRTLFTLDGQVVEPADGARKLVGAIQGNPLQALREWCSPGNDTEGALAAWLLMPAAP